MTLASRRALIALAAAAALACAAPDAPPSRSAARPAAAALSTPTSQELANTSYRGLEDLPEPIALRDGVWHGAPFVAGGAARPELRLVPGLRAVGDLDGDGAEEAVVLLASSSGGSGERVYLAVVARRDGGPVNVATALLGDRVKVRAVEIEGRRVLVFLVRAGTQDALCCPGDLAVLGFELRAGGVLASREVCESGGRLSPETLAGVRWVLRAWDLAEPAPAAPEVTLEVEGGRISGSAGCNRYGAPVAAGEAPGALVVGPAIATRMACEEPAASVEDRFLAALARVDHFGFWAGRLALGYRGESGPRTLVFDAQPADAPGAARIEALRARFCRAPDVLR